MKSGTAIGLFVGGAVLLIATAPKTAPGAVPGAAPIYPNPGGALNPLNWFGAQGSGAPLASSIFGTQQPVQQPFGNGAPQPYPQAYSGGPYVTPGGGLLQPSNYVQPATFGSADGFYSGSNGAGLVADYSNNDGGWYLGNDYSYNRGEVPVPDSFGGVGYDYYPVMLPDGSFADLTYLASLEPPYQQNASFDSGYGFGGYDEPIYSA